MGYSLYFSGRADDERNAQGFLDALEEAAASLQLTCRREDSCVVIEMASAADDLRIDIDERHIFEGALQPSRDDSDADLKTLALLFGPTHQQLNAFFLLDGNAQPLFEHGDVDGLEAELEEDFDQQVKAEQGHMDSGPLGPLDTPWFTHCRLHQTEHGMQLDITPQARQKIGDKQWDDLLRSITGLRGVAQASPLPHDPGFELVMLGSPTAEDSKRIAIATSFMIDDAIESTTAARSDDRFGS